MVRRRRRRRRWIASTDFYRNTTSEAVSTRTINLKRMRVWNANTTTTKACKKGTHSNQNLNRGILGNNIKQV